MLDAPLLGNVSRIVGWRKTAEEPVVPAVAVDSDEADRDERGDGYERQGREPARGHARQATPDSHRARCTARQVKTPLSDGEDRYRRRCAESRGRSRDRRDRRADERHGGPSAQLARAAPTDHLFAGGGGAAATRG